MADSSLVLTNPAPANGAITVLTDIDTWAGAKVPVVARYMGQGGAAKVPPVTAAEVGGIHAVGRALFPIYNDSLLNQGHKCANAAEFAELGAQDAAKALEQYDALGGPDGVYVGVDVEYGAHFGEPADGANWFLALARAGRASRLAGAFVIYCSAASPGLVEAYKAALATGDPDVARIRFWIARWDWPACIAANLPDIDPDQLGMDPDIAERTVAIQFCAGAYGGVCDLSVLFVDRLQAAGPGGFWLPAQAAPAPAPLPPAIPAPRPRTVMAQVPVRIDEAEDKAYVTAALSGPREHGAATEFIFDTGAFEILLDLDTAQALGLPSLQQLTIGGVTGSAQGYTSKVDFNLGQLSMTGADCAVMPNAPRLFGLRWFLQYGYAFELDPKAATLTVYGPEQ